MKIIFKKQRRVKIAIRKCSAITFIYKRKIMLQRKVFENSVDIFEKNPIYESALISQDQPTNKNSDTAGFSCKQEPMLAIQSAISITESVERLLVPHNSTAFFNNGGITRFLAHQRTFSAWSSPIPKFNSFSGIKYLCHWNLSIPPENIN